MVSESMTAGHYLSYANVLVAFCFVLLDIIVSATLNLGLSSSLLIAAIRCALQLSFLGYLLKAVFLAESPWATAGMTFAIVFLAANEVAFTRVKQRHDRLFMSSLVSLLSSVAPVAILGSKFAMAHRPFWSPKDFIPVTGMIAGNAMSAMAVSLNTLMKSVTTDKDRIEVMLAYGSTRFEALLPACRESIRLALLPTINQMSIMGLISIPGMMTGSLLSGAPVEQAARLQMIIAFLITASAVLSSLTTILFACIRMTDNQHRIRTDRLNLTPSIIDRARKAVQSGLSSAKASTQRLFNRRGIELK